MALWLGLHALTVAFYAGFAVFVYLRRPPPALWPTLFWTQVAALAWVAGDLGAILSRDLVTKQGFLLILYSGSIPMAALWWLLSLRFAEAYGVAFRWGRHPLVWAPLGFAGLCWLAFLTNPWHGGFVTPVLGGRQEHHWMWWAASSVNQTLALATCGVYGHIARRTDVPERLRDQADILFACAIAVVLANWIDVLIPWAWPVDVTIAAGAVIGGLFLYGLYQSDLFDLSPVALEQIVRADPSGVIVADPSMRIRYANDAARRILDGASLGPEAHLREAISQHLVAAEPERETGAPDPFDRALATVSGDGRLYRRLGRPEGEARPRWIWLRSSPLPGCAGARGLRCIRLQDVTDLVELVRNRRSLAEQLRQARRFESLGVFAGGIAHELAVPLTTLRTSTERALSRLESGGLEAGRASLEEAAAEARRCADIVSHMLRLATGETDDLEPLDLVGSVERACERALALARDADCALEVSTPAQPVEVRAGAEELEQVLSQVIRNALQAGASRISVVCESDPRHAYLQVRDDGAGMEEAVRQRAQEPFFTTRRSEGGTGLGLAVAHGVLARLGGTLEIESKPGLGTLVELRIPLSKDEESDTPT